MLDFTELHVEYGGLIVTLLINILLTLLVGLLAWVFIKYMEL